MAFHFVTVVLQGAAKSCCLFGFNTASSIRSTGEETDSAGKTFDVSFGKGEGSSPFHATKILCLGAQNLRRLKTDGTAHETNLAAFLVILVRDHSNAERIFANGKTKLFCKAKTFLLGSYSDLAVSAVIPAPAADTCIGYTATRHVFVVTLEESCE